MNTLSSSISCIWKRIPLVAKTAVLAALVVGLIAHMPFAANHFINHDSVDEMANPQLSYMLSQGKWLQTYMFRLAGKTVSPNVNTIFCVLLIAFSAAFTTCALKIEKPIYAALIGSVMALTPSIPCTLLYQFGFGFFSALFFASAAAFCTIRMKKFGRLAGIGLLTLSLGTYMAYISFTAGVFVIASIIDCLELKQTPREILRNGIKYICVLIASIALYYITLQLFLKFSGVALDGYRGIEKALSLQGLSMQAVITEIIESYNKVFQFFFFDRYGGNPTSLVLLWSYRLCVVGVAASALYLAFKNHLIKSIGRTVLAVFCICVFPLAIHLIGVLGLNANTTWLMIYAFVLAFVFLLKLADSIEGISAQTVPECRTDNAKPKAIKTPSLSLALCATTLVITLSVSYGWFLTDTQCYEKARYTYEHVYATCAQLRADIDSTTGFDEKTMPVAIKMERGAPAFSGVDYFPHLSGYTGIDHESAMVYGAWHVSYMLKNYIGADYSFCGIEKVYDQPEGRERVESMPLYPKPGSVEIVEDILVVKMAE